jgi:hypothetical protein
MAGQKARQRCLDGKCSGHATSASTKEDDIIGRVLWAISDPSGVPAKIFADLNPAPPFEWLERLAEERFGYSDLRRFGIHPKDKEDPALRSAQRIDAKGPTMDNYSRRPRAQRARERL